MRARIIDRGRFAEGVGFGALVGFPINDCHRIIACNNNTKVRRVIFEPHLAGAFYVKRTRGNEPIIADLRERRLGGFHVIEIGRNRIQSELLGRLRRRSKKNNRAKHEGRKCLFHKI